MLRSGLVRGISVAILAGLLLGGCASREPSRPGARDLDDLAPMEMVRLGQRFEQAGDLATAMRVYRQAAESAPELAEPLVAIGDLQLAAGGVGPARESYRAALERFPDDPGAVLGLARTDIAAGRAEQARTRIEALHGAGTASPRSFNALGVALDLLGRHTEARTAYARALEEGESGDADVLTNLGLSLAVSGEYEAALDVFRELEERSATQAQARENMALVLGMRGEADAAEALAATVMPDARAAANRTFYRRLAGLEGTALARAAFLGELPPASQRAGAEAVPPADGMKEPAAPEPARDSPEPAPALDAAPEPAATAETGEEAASRAEPDPDAEPDEPTPDAPAGQPDTAPLYHLQLGAFGSPEQVRRQWRELRDIAVLDEREPLLRRMANEQDAPPVYRLLVGPIRGHSSALELCRAILDADADCVVMPEQPETRPLQPE